MERKPVVIAQEELAREAAVCGEIKAWWASRGRTPRAYVDTYGCQQNEADSERIRGMLRASGYDIVDTEEGADCIVINTCAIREHAETRVYGNVGALVHTKARHPEQKIFLCGCMMGQPQVVERIKNSYRHVDGVFFAVGGDLFEFARSHVDARRGLRQPLAEPSDRRDVGRFGQKFQLVEVLLALAEFLAVAHDGHQYSSFALRYSCGGLYGGFVLCHNSSRIEKKGIPRKEIPLLLIRTSEGRTVRGTVSGGR